MRKVLGRCGAAMVAMAVVSGCVTTEQASQAIGAQWTGQSADAFFLRYGPPRSEYGLSSGDVMYTWRGGETTKHIPATYAAPAAPALPPFGTTGFGGSNFGAPPPSDPPLFSRERTRTQTTVETPGPGVTRTTTTTTTRSASIGVAGTRPPAAPSVAGRQMLSPARTEQLYCELQLTVDPGNMIRSIRISGDTAAAGIGLSRCAEVLDVKPR